MSTARIAAPSAPPAGDRSRRHPLPWRPALVTACVGVACALPWLGLGELWVREGALTAIFALIVSGLNLSYGYAGQLSFGQPALFAVGAYVGGYMAMNGANDLLVVLATSATATAICGAIIGIPGLRLSSWSLAMVSFFVVLLIPDLTTIFQAQTGGLAGLAGIPLPEEAGVTLSTSALYAACVLTAAAWLLVFRNLVRSRYGWAFLVLSESPVLAEAHGINVYAVKLECYILGSIPAGVAGALFAYLDGYVSPDSFGFSVAIGILAASILGGRRSVLGAVIGAALLQIGPLESDSFASYSLVVYGGLLLVSGLLLRRGITSILQTWIGRLRWRGQALVQPSAGQVRPEAAAARVTATDLLAELSAPQRAAPQRAGLQIADVSKSFGGVQALRGVSLEAARGRITALIGPNGSGKTTLLNVVSGFCRPSGGRVSIGTTTLDGRASTAARAGVARTFQTPSIPSGLTVVETVAVARFRREPTTVLAAVLRTRAFRRLRARDFRLAFAALELAGIRDVAEAEAASLPLGLRRRVEVARAIAALPDVLLLDEPASGLSEAEVAELGRLIGAVRDAGVPIVLVEHNFPFVLDIADQIYVLDLGEVIATGAPAQIRDDPRVIESYLGKPAAPLVSAAPGKPAAPPAPTARQPATARPVGDQAGSGSSPPRLLLEAEHLAAGYGDLRAISDVSLTVAAGQTTVVLGSNGAGKTTSLLAIAGFLPLMAGEVRYEGRPLAGVTPHARAARGIALVQEGKHIFRELTVEQNLMIGSWALRRRGRRMHPGVEQAFERFGVLAANRHRPAGSLSGGQQQILAIAQALVPGPAVLLLDEPSAGLAPALVDRILEVTVELCREGMGVVLVEQLVDAALGVADRVVVLSRGRTSLTCDDARDFDRSRLRDAYLGMARG